MPIALVSNTKRVANDGGTTSAIDTTGATLLVAVGAYFGASAGGPGITISDSNGNTWTALTERGPASTKNCRIWYAVNPTVGSGHTFTVTGTDSFSSVYFSAWSGVATTSPLDQNTGRNSTDGTGAYSGAVNPTEGNELVIAGWCHSSTGATASAASGWTLGDHNVATSGADGNFGGGFSYQIQTTATNIADLTQVAVLSTSETTVSATATFKAGAGGGGVVIPVIQRPYFNIMGA